MTLATSVVICAYTEARWDQLCSAVTSVLTQRRPVGEIIVVIDHNDALLARARVAFPAASVLANASAQGLSGARNTGIEASAGDVVCFLDDDAVAEPDWSAHLLAPYEDRGVLGVGGAAIPAWETAPPVWWPAEFGWVVGCSYRGQPTTTSPVRNLMGCNMSLRRTVLAAAGGFDTGLGRHGDNQAGCEETELCIRAGELFPDGVFLHEPLAVVRHHVPGHRASWRYFSDRCRAEGVSKAGVARRVGRSAALASETGYVRRVLPSGVLTNLGRTLRGDLAGVARAGAIVAGLGLTTAGFLSTRWHLRRLSARGSQTTASPVELPVAPAVLPLVIDLDKPMPAIDPHRGAESAYERALCLVTLGGRPVGKVQIPLDQGVLPPELVGARLRHGLGPAVDLSSAGGGPSAHPPADATVVIATRERPERLAECLRSVLAGTLQPQRVVVVDNAPTTTRTAELVAELAATEPRLRYVREDRPGLARAHNAGLPHVLTPIVAFTDDDVLADPRWLGSLVDAFADGEVVCVTGMIAPRALDTLPQQWVEGNATYDKGLQRRVFDTGVNRPADPLFPYTAGVFGSGANMAFRTDYLRRRRGFDAALGTGTTAMGGDDLAAFYDVIRDGHRLVYEPAAIVLHQHYADYAALRRQTYGYGAGLGAHLTRCLIDDPRLAVALVRFAPSALRRAGAIVRPPVVGGLPPYPADLSRQQLRGLASGPWRYLRSRKHARREVA
ncbi:MAG TPA: glycosyltransferase family 2 protein [Microlunatus sp.]